MDANVRLIADAWMMDAPISYSFVAMPPLPGNTEEYREINISTQGEKFSFPSRRFGRWKKNRNKCESIACIGSRRE